MESTQNSTGQAAWTIAEYSKIVKVTRQTIHHLPEDCQPESVRIGRRRLIIEAPEHWLRRMHERGGAPSRSVVA